jgi:hypothetical protein
MQDDCHNFFFGESSNKRPEKRIRKRMRRGLEKERKGQRRMEGGWDGGGWRDGGQRTEHNRGGSLPQLLEKVAIKDLGKGKGMVPKKERKRKRKKVKEDGGGYRDGGRCLT